MKQDSEDKLAHVLEALEKSVIFYARRTEKFVFR